MLVATMNPHLAIFLGDPKRECTCTSLQIRRYRTKISGPLMDRIALHMEAPSVPYKNLASLHEGASYGDMAERVRCAHAIQGASGGRKSTPMPG